MQISKGIFTIITTFEESQKIFETKIENIDKYIESLLKTLTKKKN